MVATAARTSLAGRHRAFLALRNLHGPAAMRAQVTKESAMFGDIIKRGNVKTQ